MKIFLLWAFCVASGVQSKIDQIENIESIQSLIIETINEPAPSFEPCNEELLQKANYTDMIEIKRHGYFHWCVFIGGVTVIQLNNPEFNRLTTENAFDNFTGRVELRNLPQLAGNDFCRINNKMSESKRKELPVLPTSDTVKIMKEEIERNVTYYNIFDYNCEHFATKLKFGVPFSSQIEAVKKISAKDQVKQIVAKMFAVAATLDSTDSSNESFPHLLSALRFESCTFYRLNSIDTSSIIQNGMSRFA